MSSPCVSYALLGTLAWTLGIANLSHGAELPGLPQFLASSTTAPAAVTSAAIDAPPGLPAATLARAAIDTDPGVLEARSILGAAGYRAAALRLSPHEWTARLTLQQRREDAAGASNEWHASIERALRSGDKAAIDRALGDVGIAVARARIGEARHEAARVLVERKRPAIPP